MKENINGNFCEDVETAGENEGAGSTEGNSSATHNSLNSIDEKIFKSFGEIDSALCNDENRFILLYPWQKVPSESEWTASTIEETRDIDHAEYICCPKLHNYKWDDPYLQGKLKQGYNCGMICRDTHVFDADALDRLTELGVIDALPPTRTVRTARGGTHMYLKVTGKSYKLVLYDPESGHEKTNEKGNTRFVYNHLGELQIGKFQVVCAGSTYRKTRDDLNDHEKNVVLKHPEWQYYKDCFEGPELKYETVNDLPIAEISFEDIKKVFEDKGIRFRQVLGKGKTGEYNYDPDKQRLVDQIGLKVENLVVDTSSFRFSGDEIQGPHPVHGSENGFNFAINPAKNTWCCYRCNSGGDAITLVAVLDGIIDCSEAVGWEDTNGKKRSLWASDKGRKLFPQVLDAIRARGYTVPELKHYDLTDIGNAERFADMYGNDLKYFTNKGNWLFWNGKMWVDCNHMEEERYCKAVPRAIKEDAERITDAAYQDKVRKWANTSASYQKLKNTLNTAKSDEKFVIDIDDFLSDTRYFNMQNGVLDIETLKFLEHDRKRMLTKMSNVNYDPEAKCPLWLDMMEMIFKNDVELIKYVQRLLGYLLTGKPIEQAWFFFYGATSKNGKSTFCNAIEFLMADYAKKVSIKTFLNENKSSIPNDIAGLAGYYFIWASEPNEGKELSMEIIKPFSGNEPMNARFLHKEFFQFRPQGSIFILANNRPIIKEKGDAAWRRVQSIPFEVQIPEEKRDLGIDEKLKTEASGIFNWMLEGLREYRGLGNRLCPPKSVIASTEAYKEDMNSFKKFWTEMIALDKTSKVSNSELWLRYKDFCVEYGLNCGLKREFVDQISALSKKYSFKGDIKNNQQYWFGIRLKTDNERNE
jgi:P4 family phage/plasmid primase-like protien